MCCFQHRKCLGNILDQSFEELWFGPVAQAIREETLGDRFHPTCQTQSCPYRHLKVLPKQEATFFHYPIEFEIDLPSQHCNIGGEDPNDKHPACLMCERHLYYVKQDDRLKEVCERIKPYTQYVRSIHIQGIAEAFWKDRIFDILDWLGVEQYKEQITITTTTNGTILPKARRERWLKYPKSIVTFSIDAATPETFRLIRRVDMFDKIMENLTAYAQEPHARSTTQNPQQHQPAQHS